MNKLLLFASLLLCIMFNACLAPRVINQSAKVTEKGAFTGGVSATGNISGQAGKYFTAIAKDQIERIKNEDTVKMDATIVSINKAALAHAVDPIGFGYDFYLRYGIFKNMEIGYKLAGKANVFNYQYQFLGANPNLKERKNNRMYGSIAVQFSMQSYKLPKSLGDLQDLLNYSFKRRDLLVPLIFSYSFGNEEEYGSFSFGATYSYTRLKYSSIPTRLVNDNNIPFAPENVKQGFHALGGFMNVKIGYKAVFLIPAFSIFYQDYGTFRLLNGNAFGLRGWSFVPSLSLQFQTSPARKK